MILRYNRFSQVIANLEDNWINDRQYAYAHLSNASNFLETRGPYVLTQKLAQKNC